MRGASDPDVLDWAAKHRLNGPIASYTFLCEESGLTHSNMESLPATPSYRFVAALINWTVGVFIGLPTAAILYVTNRDHPEQLVQSAIVATLVPAATVLFCAWRRANFGMFTEQLYYGARDGRPIGVPWAAARILLGILLFPLLPISAIICLADPLHRNLSDLMCGTAIFRSGQYKEDVLHSGFEVIPLANSTASGESTASAGQALPVQALSEPEA